MNLLTPTIRSAALREAREGLTFCLSLPLNYPGGTVLSSIRKPPRLIATKDDKGTEYYNLPLGDGTSPSQGIACDDAVLLHTQYSTQWDSLAHWGARFDADDDGEAEWIYYNGYRPGVEIRPPDDLGNGGASALGIETLALTGVQGRAVVVSLSAQFGLGRTLIDVDMLRTALKAQGVEICTGDFLLLHTGFDEALLAMQGHPDGGVLSRTGAVLDGRDARLLEWIAESGLVAICSDNEAVEAPEYSEPDMILPLHEFCLFKQGIFLGELWWLGELSKWLLARKRTACLLTAPPLRLPGAVGSPVTPIATV